MKPKRLALVTGATSGIGEATAYRLQARGYDVTDEAAVTRLVEEI